MKWTKDKPTKEGMYYFEEPGCAFDVVYLAKDNDGTMQMCDMNTEEWMWPLTDTPEGSRFAGPLPEPRD